MFLKTRRGRCCKTSVLQSVCIESLIPNHVRLFVKKTSCRFTQNHDFIESQSAHTYRYVNLSVSYEPSEWCDSTDSVAFLHRLRLAGVCIGNIFAQNSTCGFPAKPFCPLSQKLLLLEGPRHKPTGRKVKVDLIIFTH